MKTSVIKKSKQNKRNRKHDGFFRYVYSVPKNASVLLTLAAKHNQELARMLSSVDLTTLKQLPGSYSEVGEQGEADIAFKVKLKSDFPMAMQCGHLPNRHGEDTEPYPIFGTKKL